MNSNANNYHTNYLPALRTEQETARATVTDAELVSIRLRYLSASGLNSRALVKITRNPEQRNGFIVQINPLLSLNCSFIGRVSVTQSGKWHDTFGIEQLANVEYARPSAARRPVR
ncbi:hypothetical protein GGR92_005245 [Spirosoma lacussanchae]|uniref:hypothetical protein n=1 Tax=Spirosoma lacussanchae TaxID=1884249 RepID=UPI0011082FB2|nr:hypothetical protein [Spirosoma lacussanchae]